ncbi:transcriptional regulator, partial [Mesorhizobium sp. M7A.F.Ca.CA.004.05.1.1]
MTDSLMETNAPGCTPDSRAVATRLAALSHPARIEILKYLSASNSCYC